MSVTPFSAAALDRVLKAVFATLGRHGAEAAMQPFDAAAQFRADSAVGRAAIAAIRDRALAADPAEAEAATIEARRLAYQWEEAAEASPSLVYQGGGRGRQQLLHAYGEGKGIWEIQTSMRFVEEEVDILIWHPRTATRRVRA
jgi:hypothetical protein